MHANGVDKCKSYQLGSAAAQKSQVVHLLSHYNLVHDQRVSKKNHSQNFDGLYLLITSDRLFKFVLKYCFLTIQLM